MRPLDDRQSRFGDRAFRRTAPTDTVTGQGAETGNEPGIAIRQHERGGDLWLDGPFRPGTGIPSRPPT